MDTIEPTHAQMSADGVAAIIAGLALVISILSYAAAERANKFAYEANKALMFDKRISVFDAIAHYLHKWYFRGEDDFDAFAALTAALPRARFLFPEATVKQLDAITGEALSLAVKANAKSAKQGVGSKPESDYDSGEHQERLQEYSDKVAALRQALEPYIKVE